MLWHFPFSIDIVLPSYGCFALLFYFSHEVQNEEYSNQILFWFIHVRLQCTREKLPNKIVLLIFACVQEIVEYWIDRMLVDPNRRCSDLRYLKNVCLRIRFQTNKCFFSRSRSCGTDDGDFTSAIWPSDRGWFIHKNCADQCELDWFLPWQSVRAYNVNIQHAIRKSNKFDVKTVLHSSF